MFPYTEEIVLSPHLNVHYKLVLDLLLPQITPERQKRFDEVLAHRTFEVATVCESLYDRGNVSAVVRSAEAFGFAPFHVIETSEKYKNSARVTRGAEKWIEERKWPSTESAVEFLKSENRKLIVTSLDANIAIDDIDFSQPVALVLGNEKDGVSEAMKAAADYRIKIPMYGFVQSFNISVAAAICLYHIAQKRKNLGKSSELTELQKEILRAHYVLRTLDSGADQLREYFSRQR
ncbi:MAG: RNA methyltransferase [Bdellovibrionaceae bacterium]|nr:RNA methyltransferase [Pseudobdellovibrionaceae bacterium]